MRLRTPCAGASSTPQSSGAMCSGSMQGSSHRPRPRARVRILGRLAAIPYRRAGDAGRGGREVALTEVEVGALALDRLETVIGPERAERFRSTAAAARAAL